MNTAPHTTICISGPVFASPYPRPASAALLPPPLAVSGEHLRKVLILQRQSLLEAHGAVTAWANHEEDREGGREGVSRCAGRGRDWRREEARECVGRAHSTCACCPGLATPNRKNLTHIPT